MTPNMNVTLPGGLRISTLPASSAGGPTAASSSGGLPTPTSAGGLSSLAPTGGMATGSGLTHAPEQPPHPTQDGVYSAVAKFRKAARVAPFLLPGGFRVTNSYGNLFAANDNRFTACTPSFRFGDKKNVMYSFNLSTFHCVCCTDKALPLCSATRTFLHQSRLEQMEDL